MDLREKLQNVLSQFNPKSLFIEVSRNYRFSNVTKNDFYEFVSAEYIDFDQVEFPDVIDEKIYMDKLKNCCNIAIPNYQNIEAALKVGLIPFTYNGEFHLAAEDNVDPDPKYEAYYAITHNALFSGTIYTPDRKEDWNYFKTIVGEKVAKEVEEAVSLPGTEFIIHILI